MIDASEAQVLTSGAIHATEKTLDIESAVLDAANQGYSEAKISLKPIPYQQRNTMIANLTTELNHLGYHVKRDRGGDALPGGRSWDILHISW